MEEPWSLWLRGVLGFCGIGCLFRVTLCSWLIGSSHRLFSRNAKKKKKKKKADPDEDGLAHFLLFLTKSMFRPLCHTSERRRYGQIQSLFKVRPSVSNSLFQTACCAFSTLWVICGPGSCLFFFFSPSLSSVEWHFHLSNWAEPSIRLARRGHMQRCDIRLAAWGIGSEKQTARPPGELTQKRTYTPRCTHACTFRSPAASETTLYFNLFSSRIVK